MKPTTLLFTTSGRIGPRTFWRGIIILVAAYLIINLISLLLPPGTTLEMVMTMVSMVLMVALLVGYVSVYAKRLHDSGRTGAWFILAFLAFVVLSTVLGYALMPLLAPDVFAALFQLVEAYELGNIQVIEVRQAAFEAAAMANPGSIFLMITISVFAVNLIIGWFVARLPSDRGTNRFGPPEGGDTHAFD